jgi:hypothetical protein
MEACCPACAPGDANPGWATGWFDPDAGCGNVAPPGLAVGSIWAAKAIGTITATPNIATRTRFVFIAKLLDLASNKIFRTPQTERPLSGECNMPHSIFVPES